MSRTGRLLDTQVLIIGNGPAGLSLSAFLSGVLPFYNTESPHPDPFIHSQFINKSDESLIDQNLSWCDDMPNLTHSGRTLSVLYDTLVRPGADIGEECGSSLQWEIDASRSIPHIVLGETDIGGSWNIYDGQMLAVSFSTWMSLPGFSIEEYFGNTGIPRLPSMLITKYMKCYAEQLGLRKNIQSNSRVISIQKRDGIWITEGRRSNGRPFTITSKQIVLASGKTKPRRLELDNEESCNNVVYDVPSLKERLGKCCGMQCTSDGRVIIVGDGISSADAVRNCLARCIPVLHVIRRTERQLRNVLMARLSPSHYSEYTTIYNLMTGKETDPLYQRMTSSTVIEMDNHRVIIQTPNGQKEEFFSLLCVLIGRYSDMNGILQGKYSFIGYQSEEDKSLFSIGSYAGDHFVRYLIGGCLDVARQIHSTYLPSS